MANIVITPAELRDCAKNLGTYLEDYKTHVSAVNDKIDDIEKRWSGAAHDEFLKQFTDDFKPFLNDDIPNVVDTLISELNGVAKAIDDTDAEIADSLS